MSRGRAKEQEIRLKQFDLEWFQQPFFESPAWFPGFIGGWGTGKTLLLILRAIYLSVVYPNNYGWIIRKEFTNLRNSTVKDFEDYTGLKVDSKRQVKIPGTNSIIEFRHGDEVKNLIQNVNLGWFGIEQAEEFDNAETFDMLWGRTRRKLEIDRSITTDGPYGKFIEFLQSREHKCGMIIANANGHNWVWERWVRGVDFTQFELSAEEKADIDNLYIGYEAKTHDNIHNLPDDFLKRLNLMRFTSPKKYRRYVLNSHEEMDIEGSYYGQALDEIQALGRITDVAYAPNCPVHVVMDPGYHTALWFFQIRATEPVFLRAYEGLGLGVEGIIALLEEYEKKYRYNYGSIFAPVDIDNNAHRTAHGDTLLEAFAKYDICVCPLDLEKRVTDGIDRTERFIRSCWFDKHGCEVGLNALWTYHQGKNVAMSTEERPVFTGTPAKGWEAHLADAFRYASMSVPLAQTPTHYDDYEYASGYVNEWCF